MKIKELIGIDVSKLFLDVRLHLCQHSSQFDNTPFGIEQLLSRVEKLTGLKKAGLFFIFEHTGLYSCHLAGEFTNTKLVPQTNSNEP